MSLFCMDEELVQSTGPWSHTLNLNKLKNTLTSLPTHEHFLTHGSLTPLRGANSFPRECPREAVS